MNLNPEVDEQNDLRCHYAGNMGARPGPTRQADGTLVAQGGCVPPGGSRGGGTWGWPESTYIQAGCGCASAGGSDRNKTATPPSTA